MTPVTSPAERKGRKLVWPHQLSLPLTVSRMVLRSRLSPHFPGFHQPFRSYQICVQRSRTTLSAHKLVTTLPPLTTSTAGNRTPGGSCRRKHGEPQPHGSLLLFQTSGKKMKRELLGPTNVRRAWFLYSHSTKYNQLIYMLYWANQMQWDKGENSKNSWNFELCIVNL